MPEGVAFAIKIGTSSNSSPVTPSIKPPSSWCASRQLEISSSPCSILKASSPVGLLLNVFDSCIKPAIAIRMVFSTIAPAGTQDQLSGALALSLRTSNTSVLS